MKRIEKSKAFKSSGNVFRDLGLPDPEALLLKAEVAMSVVRSIEERGLTQNQAAKLLGMKQPKVSDLMNGKISGFSLERLLKCLIALGHDVTIQETKRRKDNKGRLQFIVGAA